MKKKMHSKQFIFLFFLLTACKSKTLINLNENSQHIQIQQQKIQEIKTTVEEIEIEIKQCNSVVLETKINILKIQVEDLEKETHDLKISNEKAIIEYKAEKKQYRFYKTIVCSCFMLGCLFLATKINLLR